MQAVSFKKMKTDQRTLVMLFEMEHSVVDMIIKDFRYCFIVVHSSTVSGHNYSPPLENSIDLHVFSCLQEKIFCLFWSTYIHVFGVI